MVTCFLGRVKGKRQTHLSLVLNFSSRRSPNECNEWFMHWLKETGGCCQLGPKGLKRLSNNRPPSSKSGTFTSDECSKGKSPLQVAGLLLLYFGLQLAHDDKLAE